MMSPKDKPKKRPPKDSMTLLPCFYFVELPIVASSMASLYFLELTDVVQPAQVGFHCHDRTLSMPYVDGGEELIPLLMLLSLAFAGPAAAIMVGEGLLYCMQSKLKIRPGAEGSINAGGCNFNSFLRRTVRFVGVQIFGLLATALVTDVIQLATGYPTPFFLTVCKPNYTSPGVSCDRNPYITRDICSGRDQHAILAARKSFPSQHATLSAFAAVYISMYFNSTISDSTKLLKPVLVFAFSMAAALTGLTQITQHRSHPVDVYAGFLIGAGIAAYLALYAVGNFKSSEEAAPKPAQPTQPPRKDALRALTQRGHDSVYHKGASSESNDELSVPQRAEGRSRQARREKVSLGSLERASADVELLAPRSPMGKETMVTFSNTLPRANCPTLPEDPARRPLTFLVPPDPVRSQQLVCEWKQKSLELRGAGPRGEEGREDSVHGSDAGESRVEEEWATPSPLYPTVQANRGVAVASPAAAGTRVAIPARPVVPPLVHIPEEAVGPPPVSPKSATTRAKWLSMTEQGGAAGVAPGPLRLPGQPRVAQVIAMSKHEGRVSVTPRSSETASSCASSTSSSESACCRPPERDSSGIVTVNAHAPHHPVVHLSPGNGTPWSWRTSTNGSSADIRESREPTDHSQECPRDPRPAKSLSPASSICDPSQDPLPPPLPDLTSDGLTREALPLYPSGGERALLERAGSLLQRSSNQPSL
ncbi:hypothetical protein MATL_G00239520 [Megalops atlanticus]|uniref:Phospholipid phosphatase-related protein type 3 n=1 Tax=Megalops atlanticus TaxID=7932 RepID=A0A9D3PFM4_MEGAT|nr:hypothetical protein MATL_G00239520 [Megalops atlanticus]